MLVPALVLEVELLTVITSFLVPIILLSNEIFQQYTLTKKRIRVSKKSMISQVSINCWSFLLFYLVYELLKESRITRSEYNQSRFQHYYIMKFSLIGFVIMKQCVFLWEVAYYIFYYKKSIKQDQIK